MSNILSFQGSLLLKSQITETISGGTLLSVGTFPNLISKSSSYSNGSNLAYQHDLLFGAGLTLNATPTYIDLTNFPDPSGNNPNQNAARVRNFVCQNLSTTPYNVVSIYAAASNGWKVLPGASTPHVLQPLGIHIDNDDLSVGSGVGNIVSPTSKIIVLDPGSNTIAVSVIIQACSTP